MVTTFLVMGVVVFSIASLALAGWLLWLGARWARIPEVTFGRALLAMGLSGVFAVACRVLLSAGDVEQHYPILALAFAIGELLLVWIIIQRVLRTSFGRAILAWLPTLAGAAVCLLVVSFVFKPYVVEAYSMPTNGMAPTNLGDHLEARCPKCGGTMIIPAGSLPPSTNEQLAICAKCLQTSMVSVPAGSPLSGDRILVFKFLAPKRWDLIDFRWPEDPSVEYAKRLVGLPGEEVAIRDGEVLINGEVAKKPAAIAALTYVADPLNETKATWGPVRLGDDEYFVLGDFSLSSMDARFWQRGADGHPPYALPKSHIVGVATHIYWPISRWRSFR